MKTLTPQTDPLILAMAGELGARGARAVLLALELHGAAAQESKRAAAAREALEARELLLKIATPEGAAEVLQLLHWTPPVDMELAAGQLRAPTTGEAGGAVYLVRHADGGHLLRFEALNLRRAPDDRELRRSGPDEYAPGPLRKMIPILSRRADLGEGPAEDDLQLEPLRERRGRRVVLVPGDIDPARRFLHIWNGRRTRLAGELAFAEPKPAAPFRTGDDDEIYDDDDDAGEAA